MSDDLLTMDLRDGVALITIRREKSRNALTRDMCSRLAELIRQAAAQPDAQAIVLTGTGVAFSAGADLKELLAARDATDLSGFIEDAQQITRSMHACTSPIVAAINGFRNLADLPTYVAGESYAPCFLLGNTHSSRSELQPEVPHGLHSPAS